MKRGFVLRLEVWKDDCGVSALTSLNDCEACDALRG